MRKSTNGTKGQYLQEALPSSTLDAANEEEGGRHTAVTSGDILSPTNVSHPRQQAWPIRNSEQPRCRMQILQSSWRGEPD